MAKGSIRRLDNEGRVTIPKEIRSSLGMDPGDLVEIFVTDEEVILKKDSNRQKKFEDYTDKELLRELELRKQIRVFNEE